MSAPTAPANTTAPPTAVPTAAAAAPTGPAPTVPNPAILTQAAKLAIQQDKPLQLDYFLDSASGKAFMGEDTATKEKMLVKSAEEFTSQIQKVYKVGDDYIIMTENSIYIVSGRIQKRRIEANSLRQD